MNTRIYNTVKSGDADSSLNETFRFAGKDADYRQFGRGEWYGRSIAIVAVSRGRDVAVIAWQSGYVKGSNKTVEAQVDRFIQG